MVNEIVKHADGKIIEWKWSSNNELMKIPFWTSAYFVGDILIDCGAPDSVAEMDAYLEKVPSELRPKMCILTHHHEDHAGTGKLLVEEYHIPVYAHPDALETIKQGFTYAVYRQMSWGESGLIGFEALPMPEKILSEKFSYKFELLYLPGHADDMIAFVEPNEQWAFVGDLMLPKYLMLFGSPCPIQEDIKVIHSSLKQLYEFTKKMPNLKIFVAGKGVYQGPDIILKRISEIEALREKVIEVNNSFDPEMAEKRQMRKILRKVFDGESTFGTLTGGELSCANLVKSILKWQ
jgi:glyoxylase-like metal-dependent hydrolase (beta-lactamase superfamily II)